MPFIWIGCISVAVMATLLASPDAHSEPKAPKVILKLDDIRRDQSGLHDGWEQTLAYLDEQELPASLGIICNSLENAPVLYIDRLKALIDTDRYEFWNHGWSHTRDAKAKTSEFKGTGYEYQSERFQKSQAICKEVLGVTLNVFGAPYNAVDQDTCKVVGENPDMIWWMYPAPNVDPPAHLVLLPRTHGINIEIPVHVPNPAAFMERFEHHRNSELLVLQGHPASWAKDNRMEDFKAIITFLQEQGCEFVLPTAYARSLNAVTSDRQE